MTIKFFDFALNHTNAAVAEAVARARRDAIADGTDYRVEFPSSADCISCYWNGCAHDALCLGRELHANGIPVIVFDSADKKVNLDKVRY